MWPPHLEHTCHLPWCFWPSASSPRGAAGARARRAVRRQRRGGAGVATVVALVLARLLSPRALLSLNRSTPHSYTLTNVTHGDIPSRLPWPRGEGGDFLPDVAAIPGTNRMWTDL